MLRNIAKKFLLFIIITNVLSSCNEEPFDWSFGDFKIENVSNIVETTTNSAKIHTSVIHKGTLRVDSVKLSLIDSYAIRTVKATNIGNNEFEAEFNFLTPGKVYSYDIYIWVNGSSSPEPTEADFYRSSFDMPWPDNYSSIQLDVIKVLKDSAFIGIPYKNNLLPLEDIELGIIYTTTPSSWEKSQVALYESKWTNSKDSCFVWLKGLTPNTEYYYRSYVKYPGNIYYGEIFTFRTLDKNSKMTDTSVFVDLGLSVYWANYNIGASNSWEDGDYYAWGEIETKPEYIKDNSFNYGKDMNDFSGNPEYDVARSKWGGRWRVPTYDEIWELDRKSIKQEFKIINGHNGILFTGPNLNKIFFPLSGYKAGTIITDKSSKAYYWSSTPYYSNHYTTYGYYFYMFYDSLGSMNISQQGKYRYFGFSVRPVSD